VQFRRPLFIVVAALAGGGLSLLAAGCGGGSSPRVAGVGSSTAVTTTTGGAGTTTTESGTLAAAVAFARCMRSHGIPGWPDPTSGGVFDKSSLRALGVSVARVRALEQGPCDQLNSIASAAPTITAADRVDYARAVACMRSHGFPDFPSPTFPSVNTVTVAIPASIDQDSPAFKSAAAICTRLIPAGLPYSRASGP
jgi:hypothetical protein